MYDPPPLPSDERIDHAVNLLSKLSEVPAVHGWIATFRRGNLECTGVWPPHEYDLAIAELEIQVPDFHIDNVDPEQSWQENVARCRLAIRHGLERCDLDLDLMREGLERADARRAA
jgi:hypothetical protein